MLMRNQEIKIRGHNTCYQMVFVNMIAFQNHIFMKSGDLFVQLFAYDPAGNLIAESSLSDRAADPIIEHVYLGNRMVASITGAGQACFIATVAYGSPLAQDLDVYRAFRDQVLGRFSLGQSFTASYYHGWGPRGAEWIKQHEAMRLGTRWTLMAIALPLKVILFGHFALLTIFFLCALCACV
jgi:hypothetical protein